MNRKTLWIILAILLVTALVVGGVALRSRSRAGKQPDPAEPATGESTAPAEESAPTQTAVESPDAPTAPEVIYNYLEPGEPAEPDPNPAIRSVTVR